MDNKAIVAMTWVGHGYHGERWRSVKQGFFGRYRPGASWVFRAHAVLVGAGSTEVVTMVCTQANGPRNTHQCAAAPWATPQQSPQRSGVGRNTPGRAAYHAYTGCRPGNSSPCVSSNPHMTFMAWTALPAAPFIRLSMAASDTTRPVSGSRSKPTSA